MKHLGDITRINGHEAPPVDIITGGSPCQDLSVAGKRAGLAGERSGLFMEQIRIIKEMRNESRKHNRTAGGTNNNIRPRYMVWENVAGAFSSNNGEDFRAVLEETARIEDSGVCIPRLEDGQRWPHAGCIMGNGWSIAWRLHDAQYWGVPQRRKRISLVADFGGDTAPKILFERKSVSGHPEKSGEKRQDATATIGNDTKKTSGLARIKTVNDVSSRNASMEFQPSVYGISAYGSEGMKSSNPNVGIYKAEISRTLDLNGGSPACNQGGIMIVQPKCLNPWDVQSKHIQPEEGKAEALYSGECRYGGGESYVFCIQATSIGRSDNAGCNGKGWRENQSYTLNTVDIPAIAETYQENIGSLCARDYKGIGNQYVDEGKAIIQKTENLHTVRRLTPMECERLQGFPDGWTDIKEWTDSKGKKHKESDAPRYKALGNSIALPFWEWMAERMINELQKSGKTSPTMASLFDGIGGFPLVYSRHGCEPVWASEIEEFPMAVTRARFPEQ